MDKKKLTINELKQIREQFQQQITIRSGESRARLIIHMGTCGIAAGARDVLSAAMKALEESGANDVVVTTSSCAGLCSREPMATVEILHQPPVKYVDLTPEKIVKIFKEHILSGKIVKEYALASGSETTA
jgi:NADP-reducing hydrogenase subunit HndB